MGVDAGQTTFHLRHAYGELGAFGAGQYWSPFMDVDAFPNTLEYWGPSGAVDYRNVQVRWMPIRGDTRLTFALERPGGSGDEGRLEDRIEVQNVQARFPLPDFSGEYRVAGGWGYVEGAGILRRIQLDDLLDDAFDLDQSVFGWGVSLSSNLRPTTADIIKLQLTFGEGRAESHERSDRGRRDRTEPRRRTRPADQGGGAAAGRHGARSWSTNGTIAGVRQRATRCSISTTPRDRTPVPSTAATTRLATCCTHRYPT